MNHYYAMHKTYIDHMAGAATLSQATSSHVEPNEQTVATEHLLSTIDQAPSDDAVTNSAQAAKIFSIDNQMAANGALTVADDVKMVSDTEDTIVYPILGTYCTTTNTIIPPADVIIDNQVVSASTTDVVQATPVAAAFSGATLVSSLNKTTDASLDVPVSGTVSSADAEMSHTEPRRLDATDVGVVTSFVVDASPTLSDALLNNIQQALTKEGLCFSIYLAVHVYHNVHVRVHAHVPCT